MRVYHEFFLSGFDWADKGFLHKILTINDLIHPEKIINKSVLHVLQRWAFVGSRAL